MYIKNALRIALEAAEVSSLPLEDSLMERLNCPTENKNYSAFISAGMHIKDKYYDGERLMIRRLYLEQLNETLSEVLFINQTDKEKRVLNLRFGLGDYDKCSYKEISEMYYIDKYRVRQIEGRALHKLRPSYNFPNNLKDFL